ncbi:hypothetical protein H5410_019972 [Solanum commersonii]|uniref:Uncharacterized protein n=1 Tax=Solanum commersonii TaxID=4109 RepID=A0A9J5Z6R1_SOLCO|nr:hypothetical protein H5410_019972 [Solanum commersonii]
MEDGLGKQIETVVFLVSVQMSILLNSWEHPPHFYQGQLDLLYMGTRTAITIFFLGYQIFSVVIAAQGLRLQHRFSVQEDVSPSFLPVIKILSNFPVGDKSFIDLSLQKAILSVEMKRRPAIRPAVVDKIGLRNL